MTDRLTVVVATGNKNKVREFREIFAAAGIDADYVTAGELGIRMPEETADTFQGNSMEKADTIYRALNDRSEADAGMKVITEGNYVVIADDSGICVDALGGRPGVYSARYSEGEDGPADDEKNIVKLLREMEDVPEGERGAHFTCVISLILKNGERYSFEGRFYGEINRGKKGENGFGYDPVFYVREFGKTSAELTPEEKNKVSHRGKALRMAAEKLREKI